MSKILRKLKNASWEYDDEKQQVNLSIFYPPDARGTPCMEDLTIPKDRIRYVFSLQRFLVAVSQKMSKRRRKK